MEGLKTTVSISATNSSLIGRRANKLKLKKGELIDLILEKYINDGYPDLNQVPNKEDIASELKLLKSEVEKIRGSFFSYFKTHEQGYSMGTLNLIWQLKGYLEVILRNTYFPINDEILDPENFKKLIDQNQNIIDAHKNSSPPEQLWKSILRQPR